MTQLGRSTAAPRKSRRRFPELVLLGLGPPRPPRALWPLVLDRRAFESPEDLRPALPDLDPPRFGRPLDSFVALVKTLDKFVDAAANGVDVFRNFGFQFLQVAG